MNVLTSDNPISARQRFLFNFLYRKETTISKSPDEVKSLLQEARRHRLQGYFYDELVSLEDAEIKKGITEALNEAAKSIQRKNLSLLAEIIRIHQLAEEKSLPHIFLKGPVLSHFIHGKISPKQSMDIDIIVPETYVGTYETMLLENGYQRMKPAFCLSPKQARIHKKIDHHSIYMHSRSMLVVELHWKLMSPGGLCPITTDDLFHQAGSYDLSGHRLLMPNDEHYFVYLLLHGAKHRWYSLHWLLEFAFFIRARNINLQNSYQKMRQYGLQNPFLQSMGLLFQLTSDPRFDFTSHNVTLVRSMIQQSLVAMGTDEDKLRSKKIHRTGRVFYLLLLRKRWHYKLQCLMKPLTNHEDWEILRLPDCFFFLYYLLRPFLWLYGAYSRKRKN